MFFPRFFSFDLILQMPAPKAYLWYYIYVTNGLIKAQNMSLLFQQYLNFFIFQTQDFQTFFFYFNMQIAFLVH